MKYSEFLRQQLAKWTCDPQDLLKSARQHCHPQGVYPHAFGTLQSVCEHLTEIATKAVDELERVERELDSMREEVDDMR